MGTISGGWRFWWWEHRKIFKFFFWLLSFSQCSSKLIMGLREEVLEFEEEKVWDSELGKVSDLRKCGRTIKKSKGLPFCYGQSEVSKHVCVFFSSEFQLSRSKHEVDRVVINEMCGFSGRGQQPTRKKYMEIKSLCKEFKWDHGS